MGRTQSVPDQTQLSLKESEMKFCQELEAVPECFRIRKVFASSRIGTLSKSNGAKPETEEQVLQHLIEVYFPGSEIIQTQFGGERKGLSPQIPDSRAWKVAWSLARIFSKIRWAIESFKPFKSERHFSGIARTGPGSAVPVLYTLLRTTLAVGHIPIQLFTWRRKLPKLQCPSIFGSRVISYHQLNFFS
ncbi:hypothetical protein Trydic_g22709 [Trypoxylus dichotomus]